MKYWKFIVATASATLFGCSSSDNVAGNSAETGSPELAGVLYLDNGSPAARARVQFVPSGFESLGGVVSDVLQTETAEDGSYTLKVQKNGSYSLEAYEPESGKRLLVQNVAVSAADTLISVSDTLKAPAYATLKVPANLADGEKGFATVVGTTIYRDVVVEKAHVKVDSLPMGELDLRLYIGSDTLYFDDTFVAPPDTLVPEIPSDTSEPVLDTVVFSYVASMALPEGADSLDGIPTDIPLVLRLDSSNCDFSDFDGLVGRWEAFRISVDGTRSKSLPISQSQFDESAKRAAFWVKLDSLNVSDSVELSFRTGMEPAYANDVFPTSRMYTAVYHFDDGVSSIADGAEKANFPATGKSLEKVAGVIGSGALFGSDGAVIVEKSAASDSTKHSDFNHQYSRQLSFSVWVRLKDVAAAQMILGKGESQYDLRFSPDSGFVVEVFHQAEVFVDSTSDTLGYKLLAFGGLDQVKPDEWVYVAYSKTGNYASLFVNGEKQPMGKKVEWNGSRDESAEFKVVGPLGGAVDELMISGSARVDSWNYATYLNQRPEGYWPALSPRK